MKKIFLMSFALALTLFLAACGRAEQKFEILVQETETPQQTATEELQAENIPEAPAEDNIVELPSGIHDDGIGEVIPLTPEERSYMLAQTTNSWLEMSEQEKDDLVVLVGRSLEASDGFIVPDYEELVLMLNRQMEQYFRHGVDESVWDTVRDIYDIDQ